MGEAIVISGVSGRLPESDNVVEFREHLMKGEDMVTETDRRWPPGLFGLPRRSGSLKDISKFDASFFGVHPKQANSMDPQLRILLEVTYECLIDAGINPLSRRGSRTGVFVGCSGSESSQVWSDDPEHVTGYQMTGCTLAMFANRISYTFDFKGPSYALDTACSSSLLALDHAFKSIQNGQCDAAVVAGCHLCLKPQNTLEFQKLGVLSPDGACKSFDESANGYCRSEAVVAVYIQKEMFAKRKYTTVVNSGNNSDGSKIEGITFPSGATQQQLLQTVYKEAAVDPATVTYVEAHGTGTHAGDPEELNAIANVFCNNRQGSLLIGSTKSNMGHPEPASGLAALTKVLIAMEDGYIPGNLHFKTPNHKIPALVDGRLSVVTEKTSWSGGYVGINSFGFGGSNVHVLLKSNLPNQPKYIHPDATIPRLVTWSGRTIEAVTIGLETAQQWPQDIQLQALMQETTCMSTQDHPYRGYTIVNSANAIQETQKCIGGSHPLWYVFAGMGTQWHGMGRDLMCLESFHQSILRSDAALLPYGVKLYELFMNSEEHRFKDILYSMIGIVAIQVALVDLLTAVGLKPDGLIGHSVGELACAYADGALTAEQAIYAAYWRGYHVKQAKIPAGAMAAVGLTWKEAKARCPEGVVPACHNAVDSVTISGPLEAMRSFVIELQNEGVFVHDINTAGVAFHSYFMEEIAPGFKDALKKVIGDCPKPRSPKWISSSIPESQWNSEMALYSSADYHANNLVSPVFFREAVCHVPEDAIVLEISPHCLLQAILKRSLPSSCISLGLMTRNEADNLSFFFNRMGRKCAASSFSEAGSERGSLTKRGTKRQTTEKALLRPNPGKSKQESDSFSKPRRTARPKHVEETLVGHVIDGRVLFPASGYLVLVWKALAKITCQSYERMPVAFNNVRILRATVLPEKGNVLLEVYIMPGSGDFEVCEAGSVVADGHISGLNQPITDLSYFDASTQHSGVAQLSAADVYKELRLRGYDYGPTYQGILSASCQGNEGYLRWNGDWISFIDTMLQIQVLSLSGRSLYLPTRFRSLHINPIEHTEKVTGSAEQDKGVKVRVNQVFGMCVAGGVELQGLHTTVAPRRQDKHATPIVQKIKFVPYTEINMFSTEEILKQYKHSTEQFIHTRLQTLKNSPWMAQTKEVQKLSALVEQHDSFSMGEVQIDRFLGTPGFGLITTLQKVLALPFDDKFMSTAQHLIDEARTELATDKLLGTMREEHVLRPCLQVARENGNTLKEMRIVEIEADREHMFVNILPQLHSERNLCLSYTACVSDKHSKVTKEMEMLGIELNQWDMTKDVPKSLCRTNLVVASNVVSCSANIEDCLRKLSSMLENDGFLLLHEPVQNHLIPQTVSTLAGKPFHKLDVAGWRSVLAGAHLTVVSEKSDGLIMSTFLCRKVLDEEKLEATLMDVSDMTSFSWVPSLKEALATSQASSSAHRLWLIVKDVPDSGVLGMVNCLRLEPGGNHVRCILNAAFSPGETFPSLTQESPTFQELQKSDLVMNVFRKGHWGSFRNLSHNWSEQVVKTEHAYVNFLTKGKLSSLCWIESPLKYRHQPTRDEMGVQKRELCAVYYTSLNFRDVMLATGKLPPNAIPGDLINQDCLLGMEFSGRQADGQRVMGLVPAKGLATTVDSISNFLWYVPSWWSLEEAASVPVVYSTAYYALVIRGHISKDDKVLIHSGCGGVGQAAIAIAFHAGCEVFTTVGSLEKRTYLLNRFPQLTADHISNSHDASSFVKDVLHATGGYGVDVVLNSLSDNKLQASVGLVAQHGRFLEIGKYDLANNAPLGMAVFLKNVSFHGILLDALFKPSNPDWEQVAKLVKLGIQDGVVQPLKTTVFDRHDIEDAFRFMAHGKHIGKILVKVRDEEEKQLQPPSPIYMQARPRNVCHPDKCYIITGGLGGFGLELANWLVMRGAMHLVLTSRSGLRTGYQLRCVEKWRLAKVKVDIVISDVGKADQTLRLIKDTQASSPVGGIFHLAMVLQDRLMENQTSELFQDVALPKVAGTKHLDSASRVCCTELDWFVVFSTACSGFGNAGQANYFFANSAMERICEIRVQDGFPGLAIEWGAIDDAGVLAERMADIRDIAGTKPQRIYSCLEVFDSLLSQKEPLVSCFVLADKQSHDLVNHDSKASLITAVGHILGVKDVCTLNPNMTLANLGLDSLMGVELKQMLERDYDLLLAMDDIRQLTVNKVLQIKGSSQSVDSVSASHTTSFDIGQVLPKDAILKMNDICIGEPVFLLHPFEGSARALVVLASKLEYPVYGIQCTENTPLTSVNELAAYYLQQIKSIQPEGPHRLVGYSFGACIAFEMALQSETTETTVQGSSVLLLEGSPSYITMHEGTHADHLKNVMKDRLDATFLCGFVVQLTSDRTQKLYEKLLLQPDLDTQIEVTLDYLEEKGVRGPEEMRGQLRTALKLYHQRLLIAYSYRPERSLKSGVTLCRVNESHSVDDDYGLKQICEGVVTVKMLPGDHESFLQGDFGSHVAGIVDSWLKTTS